MSYWTEEEDAILREHWGQKSPSEIGKMINKSRSAIFERANRRLGLTSSFRKNTQFWTPEQDEFLRQNWIHMQAYEIGVSVGKSKASVIGRANRLKLPNKRVALATLGLKIKTYRGPTRETRSSRKMKPRPPLVYTGAYDIAPTCAPVHFWDVKKDQCRGIVGEANDGLVMFCGETVCKKPVQSGMDYEYVDTSYCIYHYRRYHNNVKVK